MPDEFDKLAGIFSGARQNRRTRPPAFHRLHLFYRATTTVTRQTIVSKLALPALTLSLIFGLAACGSKDDRKPATQVAARVNSEEISVHQINYVLDRSGVAAVPAEQTPKLRREILERLIDQQLAVEQAIEKKLDRSPGVIMSIEAARREILARAFVEQLASALSRPSTEDARAYYNEHPQLFSERRIYTIQEIVIPDGASETRALRELLAAGKPMEEIAIWLKGKGIKFSGGSATRTAEQIPLELLGRVHALKDGQGLLLENGPSVTVMRVAASQSSPVAETAALPRISQFLGNQRAAQAAERELKELKSKARISYQGEFAEAATPAPAAAVEQAGKTTIEKGVAGLK
jgi:EpsD family peptidyl-prolyl cis-trans isomerase